MTKAKWTIENGVPVPPRMLAYTDETGNTGLNMFDPAQPFFWTGTMITPVDWDVLHKGIHESCLARVGRAEMHGSDLGLAGIEAIAGKLMTLFARYQSHFIFTRIEKRHLIGTKFIDTVLDNGTNEAVTGLIYQVRFLRMYYGHVLIAHLDDQDRREFWEIYRSGDVISFVRLLTRLEARIGESVNDTRTRQVLVDALRWGILHPEPLLEGRRNEFDAPNIVAITLLVEELNRLNDGRLRIGTFVHDEQQQFQKALAVAFDACKGIVNPDTSAFATMCNIKKIDTFDGQFRIASSHSSFGLQALDIALWLIKRHVDQPGSLTGGCKELKDFILAHGGISSFTTDGMERFVRDGFATLETMDVSSHPQRHKIEEYLKTTEERRLERIRASTPG